MRELPVTSTPESRADAEPTSTSLIERVKLDDRDAWRRFASLYGPVVYRWTLRFGLSCHDAADVVQDVFVAAARNIGNFRKQSAGDSLRGWLFTIARNKVRDHARRRRGEPAGAGGTTAQGRLARLAEPVEPEDAPADAVTAEVAHRALRLIQTEFEPGTWRAFWATAAEGRSPADAARELELSVAAVYKAKSRVLLRLRRELDGMLD